MSDLSLRGRLRAAGASARQRGFTMVELLVALVLGLVLLAGVISIFTTTRQSFRINENMARVQENARFAFEMMARELREAGSNPCGARAMASVVRVSSNIPWWSDWAVGSLKGYDDTEDSAPIVAFGTAESNRISGTDAVLALRTISDESAIQLVSAHNVGGTTFAVPSAANYGAADVIAVCDTKSAAIVQINSVNTGSTPNEINYGSASLNCSTNLGYPTPATCAAPPAKTFDAGAVITKYEPVFWYVGANSRNGRSLYRMRLTTGLVAGTPAAQTVAEEMIPSVQNMQIEYLLRDSAAGNALATSWVGASDTAFTGATGWSETNTKQVVAMRMTLTLRSEDSVGSDGQPLTRQFIMVAAMRSRDL